MSDSRSTQIPHIQAGLAPVYQPTTPPKVAPHAFQDENKESPSEIRNVREVFGDTSNPATVSQHRAADKWDDYAFKNLARGNLDDTNVASSNKYKNFVRDSGAVQTRDKTYESKTAVIQDAHPGMRSGWSPQMKMAAHGGATLLFLLANLKMNKGVVGSIRNTAIFGILAGVLINPSIFNPILGRSSSNK